MKIRVVRHAALLAAAGFLPNGCLPGICVSVPIGTMAIVAGIAGGCREAT